MIHCHASGEDLGLLAVAGKIEKDFLVSESSCFEIVIELVDHQVVAIDEVHLCVRGVPDDSVSHSDFVLQHYQTVLHCVTVEAADALVHVENITVLFAEHRAEEETTLLIDLELIETNAVDWNFGENLDDLCHGVHAIPAYEKKTTASADNKLILLAVNRNAEADHLLSKDSEHVELVVVVQIHLEDLSAEDIAPVHHVGVLAVE